MKQQKRYHSKCSACGERRALFSDGRCAKCIDAQMSGHREAESVTALVTRLPAMDRMVALVVDCEEYTRTEVPGGRIMETFRSGDSMLCRYWFPVTADNNPYGQTAEDMIRRELAQEV